PGLVGHRVDQSQPLRAGRPATRRHRRVTGHALAVEREGAELGRDRADAARLDQRSAALDERVEEAVAVAAEAGDRAVAGAADRRRAMAIGAGLVVEDRPEAVGDRVALGVDPRAGVERVDERRGETVERRADGGAALRGDVDGGGVDEARREEDNRGTRAHQAALDPAGAWRGASYTIGLARTARVVCLVRLRSDSLD